MGADLTVDSSKEDLKEIGMMAINTAMTRMMMYSDEGDRW